MSKEIKPGQHYRARCEITHPQFIVLAVVPDGFQCEFHYQCGSREVGTMTTAEIEASYEQVLNMGKRRNGKV